MKMRELNEVKQAGQPDMFYGVAVYDDGQFNVVAPFQSKKEAERYIEWEMEEYDLLEEHRAEVITIEPPAW